MSDRGQWALWLRIENLLICIAAVAAYHVGGYSWWMFLILFLAPDLSMLGYVAGRQIGAVIYNMAHAYIGPAALLFYATIMDGETLLSYGIIWIAHIGIDRTLGFGLKSMKGFRHTHLGYVGQGPTA